MVVCFESQQDCDNFRRGIADVEQGEVTTYEPHLWQSVNWNWEMVNGHQERIFLGMNKKGYARYRIRASAPHRPWFTKRPVYKQYVDPDTKETEDIITYYYGPVDLTPVDFRTHNDTDAKLYSSMRTLGIDPDNPDGKYMGIQYDDDQEGDCKMSWELVSIDRGTRKKVATSLTTFDGTKITLDNEVIIHPGRSGVRQSVLFTTKPTTFTLTWKLHTKGLKMQLVGDEYWFYRKKDGRFFSRIGTPNVLDPDTGEPLTDKDDSLFHGAVQHHLTDHGDGTYTYTKTPGPEWSNVKAYLPAKYLIDAQTFYSDTADGRLESRTDTSWAACKSGDNLTVDVASASHDSAIKAKYQGSTYIWSIHRIYVYADFTDIDSGTVEEAKLYAYGLTNGSADVILVDDDGVTGTTLDTGDWYTGTPTALSQILETWSTSAYNNLPFDAPGIAYLEGKFGGPCWVGLWEANRDFDNDAPVTDEKSGMYLAEQAGTANDPYIDITLSTGVVYIYTDNNNEWSTYSGGTVWATVRGDTSSSTSTWNAVEAKYLAPNYVIRRMLWIHQPGILASGSVITAADYEVKFEQVIAADGDFDIVLYGDDGDNDNPEDIPTSSDVNRALYNTTDDMGKWNTADYTSGQYYAITLNAQGLIQCNGGLETHIGFVMVTGYDWEDDAPTGNTNKVQFDDPADTLPPRLKVTFSPPSSGTHAGKKVIMVS